MQKVSQQWKENQEKNLVGESFVEITYQIGDPDALPDATASAELAESWSNTAQLTSEVEKNIPTWAALELNSWSLDGSRTTIPAAAPYGDTGFASSVLSNADCSFSAVPIITIRFTTVHQPLIPGIMITWSDSYQELARDFRVTAFCGNDEIARLDVQGNTHVRSSLDMDLTGYDRIVVQIFKWSLPYHRARVSEIYVGLQRVFGKSDLMGYQHVQHADALSATLPKNAITFEISNVENQYNPNNPQGGAKYLMERQEVKVRYGYRLEDGIEWINAGTFYMSEWNAPQNGISAQFVARDLIEFMWEPYAGRRSGTLYQIAEDAIRQAGLPLNRDGTPKWRLDACLSAISVTLPDDFKYSIAEVLQLAANASCCVMYQDRNGVLRIEPLSTVVTDYAINRFNSYENAEISLSKELKSVNVGDGLAVVENADRGDVQPVDNPLIQDSATAKKVGEWVRKCLNERRSLSGVFRADPRADALDQITVEGKLTSNIVVLTDITYTYNGAFRGSYEGRIVL